MAETCKLIPTVISKKTGKEIASKLFVDLSKLLGSSLEAAKAYVKVIAALESFDIEYLEDENGEPDLLSIVNDKHIQKAIGLKGKQLLSNAENIAGFRDSNRKRIGYNNAEEALDKCIQFNKENGDTGLVAIYIYDTSTKKYYATITAKTDKTKKLIEKQLATTSFKAEVDKIAERYNLTVEDTRIFGHKLEKAGIEPEATFQAILEGLASIIHICKGDGVAVKIPPVFSSIICSIMKNNSPHNYNRLYKNIIDNIDSLPELGVEPYDDKVENEKQAANRAMQKVIERFILNQENITEDTPFNLRIKYLVDETKLFFASKNENEFTDSIERVKKKTGLDLGDVFTDVEVIETNEEELTDERSIIASSAKSVKEAFEKMIDDEIRRLAVLKKTLKKDEEGRSFINYSEKNRIQDLRDKIADETYASGIASIGRHSVTVLQSLQDSLEKLKSNKKTSKSNNKLQHKVLREISINIQAYENMIDHWNEDVLEYCEDDAAKEAIKMIKMMQDELTRTKKYFLKEHKRLVKESLESVFGPSITWNSGEKKGQTETIENIMKLAESDISFADRFMQSMGDSNDFMLKALDAINVKAKETSRLRAVDAMHKIKNLGLRMEKDGLRDTTWMYERDENGELTLNFITEVDWTKYKKDRHEFLLGISRKYGKNPNFKDLKKKKAEIAKWNSEHIDVDEDGFTHPKPELYRNPQWGALSEIQRKYIKEYLAIKEEADEFYGPGKTVASRIPIIHKTNIQRIKDAKSAEKVWDIIAEGTRDMFVAREFEEGNELPSNEDDFFDETGMLQNDYIEVLQDFNGRQIYTLPTYFTRFPKGMNKEDISLDAISSLCMYYTKASDYAAMSEVVDEIEDDILYINTQYGVKNTYAGKQIKNVANVLGTKVESESYIPGNQTAISKKAQSWKEMQLYGKKEKDEGKWGKADVSKLADTTNWITSLHNIALNPISGLANLTTGACQITTEAVGGQYFGFKDLVWAANEFFANVPGAIDNIGKRFKTDKLSLFLEKFNVMQDFEKDAREVDFAAKTRVGKLGLGSILFMFNNLGEYYMQTQAALAIAHRMKLKDNRGENINLWDAFEVKYLTDKPGVYSDSNTGYGADLIIKPGVKKANGEELTNDDIIKFVNLAKGVNQRMHGIYNEADKSMMQQYALGRMAILFRKWIIPSLNRRFGGIEQNTNLGGETEGYYRTAFRLFTQAVKELRAGQFSLAAFGEKMSETDKANLRKAAFEYATFIMIAILANGVDWPDDKKKSYGMAMGELMARREYREIGALVPSHVWLNEMYATVKSPSADLNLIQKVLNLTNIVFNPGDWTEEIENGVNKGRTKNTQRVLDLVPFVKTVTSAMNPVEKLDAYRNNSLL